MWFPIRSLLLALLCALLVVDALPRMRPAKKAMRNSLVRFGKRAETPNYDASVYGEALSPVENYETFYENTNRQPVFYY